jgi:YgiT-type zinc finger domain-containing protein
MPRLYVPSARGVAMTRECPVCHSAMSLKRIPHVQTWEDRVVVFENVPAEVCGRCGEVLFAGPVVDRLNKVLWALSPATRTMEVPVYDFSTA